MGCKAVGPVCCIMHVKEPRTLIVKEKGLAPVFVDSRLEHPAGWICARYKSYHYYYSLQNAPCIFIDLLYLALMACTSCQVVILPQLKRWKYQSPTALNFPEKYPLEDFGGFEDLVRVKLHIESIHWMACT